MTDVKAPVPQTVPQPDESRDPVRRPPEVRDLRGDTTRSGDLSAHRRHTWLYEDLLA